MEQVKAFYSNFGDADLSLLPKLYARNASFVDPVHSITGVHEIASYFEASRKGLLSCQFHFHNEVANDTMVVLEWDMVFSHRKIRRGALTTVAGCSTLLLDDDRKILKHVDYYDLGAMLYEHIPLLGNVVKTIKNKVGAA